jgi:hypothetical protein
MPNPTTTAAILGSSPMRRSFPPNGGKSVPTLYPRVEACVR